MYIDLYVFAIFHRLCALGILGRHCHGFLKTQCEEGKFKADQSALLPLLLPHSDSMHKHQAEPGMYCHNTSYLGCCTLTWPSLIIPSMEMSIFISVGILFIVIHQLLREIQMNVLLT